MKDSTKAIFEEFFERYPQLLSIKGQIFVAFGLLNDTAAKRKTIFVCGNGGSAADSEHIVGELMKSFKKKRPIDETVRYNLEKFGESGKKLQRVLEGALKTISLTSNIALSTAYANDEEPTAVFAQQLYGLAEKGDVLLAISTSGNSENCILATMTAKAMGVSVIALTGNNESRLLALADVTIQAPETETYKIQELHLPIYHCLCAMLEEENF